MQDLRDSPAAPPEFDRFARNYRELHSDNIGASGEAPEYFAAYKMRDFAELVRRYGVNPAGSFLDFGSGVGSSVRPFLEFLPSGRLLCADVSERSLAESSALHGGAVDYLHLSDGHLTVPDTSRDGAFACCVFHHIPHREHPAVLADLWRVLKPGSPLMIYEHNPLNPLTVRAVNTCPLDENAVLIGAREMARRLIAAGFMDVRVEYRVFFPAALRTLRPLENRLRWLPLGAQYMAHGRR